jgi:hypothetical protein
MKKLYLVLGLSLFLIACGSAGVSTGGSKLDIKIGGKDSTLNVKSGAVNYGVMSFTAPGKATITTSIHTIYIANFELDTTTGPGWMNTPLTAPDQMRVDFGVTGENGTNEKSPFKVGTYSTRAENVNGVWSAKILTFADGKQVETRFEPMRMSTVAQGELKITSVTADTVSGEVNITEGDKAIKGSFTAKLPAPKK